MSVSSAAPDYIAPEQAISSHEVDIRADLLVPTELVPKIAWARKPARNKV
jgi:hypothetical protein